MPVGDDHVDSHGVPANSSHLFVSIRASPPSLEPVDDPDRPSSAPADNHHDLIAEVTTTDTPADQSPPQTRPLRRDVRSSTLTASLHSLHSNRSSNTLGSAPWVASKRDRLRYSWQSLQGDESARPRIHVIRIVSEIATASAALPGGEALGFSLSPRGRRIACYNSARIFILQTAALPVNISQELALKRRPLAVEINDDGNVLAILVDPHTVRVYSLSSNQSTPLKTCKTDFACLAIALSPTGALLAVAYKDGIELFSLAHTALSTDRRAARTPTMDRLTFSQDSATLLGTTTRKDAAATVIVSVPVFPHAADGVATPEELKEAWCSGMLEPDVIDASSHAVLLRNSAATATERLFAWNAAEDTFGLMAVDDLQYDNADFALTVDPPLSTLGGLGAVVQSVPTIDEHNSTVGVIVNDRTIRLYIVPAVNPDHTDPDTRIEAHSIDHELDDEFGNPFTEVKWVHSHAALPAPRLDTSAVQGRLLVISPGSSIPLGHDQEESTHVREGGRVILFDFDPQYAGQPGQTYTFALGKAPPTLLQEAPLDVDEEIALVRRRTTRQTQADGLVSQSPLLARSVSTLGSKRGTQLSFRTSPTTPFLTHSPSSASYQPSPIAQTPLIMDSPSIDHGVLGKDEIFRPGSHANWRRDSDGLVPPNDDCAVGGSGASFILDYVEDSALDHPHDSELARGYPHVAAYERSYIHTSGLGAHQTQRPTHLPRALRRTYERAANQAALWATGDPTALSRSPFHDAHANLSSPLQPQAMPPTTFGPGALRIKTDQPQGNPPTLLDHLGHAVMSPVELSSAEQSPPGKSTTSTSTPYDRSAAEDGGDAGFGRTSEPRSAQLANPIEDLFNEPLSTSASRGGGANDSSGGGKSAAKSAEFGDSPRSRSRSRRRKRVGSRNALEHEADEAKCHVM